MLARSGEWVFQSEAGVQREERRHGWGAVREYGRVEGTWEALEAQLPKAQQLSRQLIL